MATAHHRERLEKGLRKTGIELRGHARESRYIVIDADEMLSTFTVDGVPDGGLFRASVGDGLAKARKAARSKAQGLMVFGEMVAVLWDKGAKDPALRLEAPWNYALRDSAFHLHCTYPRWGFINADDEAAVCPAHSHLVVQSWLRQ